MLLYTVHFLKLHCLLFCHTPFTWTICLYFSTFWNVFKKIKFRLVFNHADYKLLYSNCIWILDRLHVRKLDQNFADTYKIDTSNYLSQFACNEGKTSCWKYIYNSNTCVQPWIISLQWKMQISFFFASVALKCHLAYICGAMVTMTFGLCSTWRNGPIDFTVMCPDHNYDIM